MRRRTLYCDCKSQIIDTTYETVDLGLPSGVLWANKNIGALSETDYGQYFQWGDVKGYTAEQITGICKRAFNWAHYKYSNNGEGTAADMTKYNEIDGLTTLQPSDDAAVANMGGSWHMPTNANFNEILNTANCTNEWVSDYNGTGINGRLFTSKSNGNTLFFPAAGVCNNRSIGSISTESYYWSASIYSTIFQSRNLYSYSSVCRMSYGTKRCLGMTIRGVIG